MKDFLWAYVSPIPLISMNFHLYNASVAWLSHSVCGEMRWRLSDLPMAEWRIEHQQSFNHPFLSGKVQLVLSTIPVADRSKVNTYSVSRHKPLKTGSDPVITESRFFSKRTKHVFSFTPNLAHL